MDQKETFNLNSDFLAGFSTIFMKLVFVIIAVYIVVLILNFLRDKFISKKPNSERDDFIDLLTILNKLFFISGFGFITGNIIQVWLSSIFGGGRGFLAANFRGEWDYLTFGIILIFMGVGFKVGKKIIKKERAEKLAGHPQE